MKKKKEVPLTFEDILQLIGLMTFYLRCGLDRGNGFGGWDELVH